MKLDWDKMDGLIPAVVQDVTSGEIRMVGYMNEEAVRETERTGKVTFFSRSKNRLWSKGETSGNTLQLFEMVADCDGDAILVRARPAGPTCHLGTRTCFGDEGQSQLSVLVELDQLLEQREQDRPAGSYTTELFDSGVRRIAQKVGEEAVEAALAATAGDREELRSEAADLLYHLLVLLRASGVSLSEVANELSQRRR